MTALLSILVLAAPPPDKTPEKGKAPEKQGDGHAHRHGGGHHGFKDTQKYVDMFEDPSRAAWQKPAEVVAALRVPAGAAVADIGAGSGYFSLPFARAVGDKGVVYAIDIEKGMVAHLTKRAADERAPMLKAVLAEPADPKVPSPVDLVFICDTYHHIEARPAYLKKLAASLKPGARVAIVDFYKKPLPVGPPPEMKLDPEEVIREFESAGFRVVERHEFLPYQYFLVFGRG